MLDTGWQPDTVLLLAHGSRDPEAGRELNELCQSLALHPSLAGKSVNVGVLEFGSALTPPILDAFRACVARGSRRISLVPLLFFVGEHASRDLTWLTRSLASEMPDVEVRLAPLLGIDDRVLQQIATDALHLLSDGPSSDPAHTAVLLVTSGSGSRIANGDAYKAARLLADFLPGRIVEVAFLRLARPYLQQAVARCVALGARHIVVAPLFLNQGLLARRVPRKLHWLCEQYPQVGFSVLPHLGTKTVVLEVLAGRALEQEHGQRIATPVYLEPGRERCRPLYQRGGTGDPSDRLPLVTI